MPISKERRDSIVHLDYHEMLSIIIINIIITFITPKGSTIYIHPKT